jgi:NAD(P)-dependent dehydrogenase (short-subunit alcohol dehydrogenase family)
MSFTQKIIIITGASSGIGFETSKGLLNEGHVVYCAARQVEKMKPLESLGARIKQLDVTNDVQVVQFISAIIEEQKRIDVLVNNAGFALFGAVEDVSIDEARKQLEVNLIAPARLMQLVIPYMRNQHQGFIINMSSLAGKVASQFGGWYNASKFGLEGLTDTVRNEVYDFNIKVVLIEPGGIKTNVTPVAMKNLLQQSGNTVYAEKAKKLAAINRDKYSNADTIYRLVSKIIQSDSPRTRYVTGYLGKTMIELKSLLPDKWMDHILRQRLV